MARGKCFSVHDLYPEDYCFDYDAFEADPENYKFTAEDNAYLNAIELERYEDTVPMTPYERRLLRRWVISGHTATKGMTPKEQEAYLKGYTGWRDAPPDDGDSFLPINEDETPFF